MCRSGSATCRRRLVAAASNARPPTTDPGPTDPSPPTRGSSADSPRSAATTPPSRPPVPGSASATSSSPICASASRPLAVDVVNSVERLDAPDNRQGVTFSAATNGKLTVATYNCASRTFGRRNRLLGSVFRLTSMASPGVAGGLPGTAWRSPPRPREAEARRFSLLAGSICT